MTVYVDTPQSFPNALSRRLGPSVHLVTDGPPSELRAFAARLGLNPSWLQHAGTWREHYDLFGKRIERAIKLGALPISRRELVFILRSKRTAIDPPGKSKGDSA